MATYTTLSQELRTHESVQAAMELRRQQLIKLKEDMREEFLANPFAHLFYEFGKRAEDRCYGMGIVQFKIMCRVQGLFVDEDTSCTGVKYLRVSLL